MTRKVVFLTGRASSSFILKPSAKLRQYFLRQTDAVILLLKKPIIEFQPEDFHLLRVHIKRLKAVLSLTHFCVKGFDQQQYFKPYKAIFRQAGKVRELQIQATLMKKYKTDEALSGYYTLLESKTMREQQAYFTLVDKKRLRKLKKNTHSIVCFMKKVNSPGVKAFLLEKRQQIEKLLHTANLETSQAHELRKQIKEVYYLQKTFQPRNRRLSITDEFQELLGQWHDFAVISNDIIKEAKNHKLNAQEVKALMALHKKIAGHASRLFAKIESTKAEISLGILP